VDELDRTDFLEKVGEIVGLSEARELGGVVQSDVDNLLHAAFQQTFKEAFGICLREPDRENVRLVQLITPPPRAAWGRL